MAGNISSPSLYSTSIYETTSYITEAYGNGTNNSYSNHPACPVILLPQSGLVMMLLYAVVFIVGLTGNTLVIYVVLRFSNMQTVTNMYILNLAIADECYLIGIPFLIYTIHKRHWTLGKALCKMYMVSTSLTQFTSSIFLLIMSADRYIGKVTIFIKFLIATSL